MRPAWNIISAFVVVVLGARRALRRAGHWPARLDLIRGRLGARPGRVQAADTQRACAPNNKCLRRRTGSWPNSARPVLAVRRKSVSELANRLAVVLARATRWLVSTWAAILCHLAKYFALEGLIAGGPAPSGGAPNWGHGAQLASTCNLLISWPRDCNRPNDSGGPRSSGARPNGGGGGGGQRRARTRPPIARPAAPRPKSDPARDGPPARWAQFM